MTPDAIDRLSASDKAALRGLSQRNGGPLTVERALRFTEAGYVLLMGHVGECYPGRPPAYALTRAGRERLSAEEQAT